MSKEDVQKLVGQLVGDDRLRDDFFKHPEAVVAASGLSISSDEMAALKNLKPSDLNVQPVTRGGGSIAIKISSLTE